MSHPEGRAVDTLPHLSLKMSSSSLFLCQANGLEAGWGFPTGPGAQNGRGAQNGSRRTEWVCLKIEDLETVFKGKRTPPKREVANLQKHQSSCYFSGTPKYCTEAESRSLGVRWGCAKTREKLRYFPLANHNPNCEIGYTPCSLWFHVGLFSCPWFGGASWREWTL